MKPGDQPRNDNWNPADGEAPEPGLFSTRQRAIESKLSLIGLFFIFAMMVLILDAKHWWIFAAVLAVSFVGMLAAGIFRLVFRGRA